MTHRARILLLKIVRDSACSARIYEKVARNGRICPVGDEFRMSVGRTEGE
jgi:hypothetical protein